MPIPSLISSLKSSIKTSILFTKFLIFFTDTPIASFISPSYGPDIPKVHYQWCIQYTNQHHRINLPQLEMRRTVLLPIWRKCYEWRCPGGGGEWVYLVLGKNEGVKMMLVHKTKKTFWTEVWSKLNGKEEIGCKFQAKVCCWRSDSDLKPEAIASLAQDRSEWKICSRLLRSRMMMMIGVLVCSTIMLLCMCIVYWNSFDLFLYLISEADACPRMTYDLALLKCSIPVCTQSLCVPPLLSPPPHHSRVVVKPNFRMRNGMVTMSQFTERGKKLRENCCNRSRQIMYDSLSGHSPPALIKYAHSVWSDMSGMHTMSSMGIQKKKSCIVGPWTWVNQNLVCNSFLSFKLYMFQGTMIRVRF